eukprot:scaffold11097_cov116-Isochrysis_galbana.AAC.2
MPQRCKIPRFLRQLRAPPHAGGRTFWARFERGLALRIRQYALLSSGDSAGHRLPRAVRDKQQETACATQQEQQRAKPPPGVLPTWGCWCYTLKAEDEKCLCSPSGDSRPCLTPTHAHTSSRPYRRRTARDGGVVEIHQTNPRAHGIRVLGEVEGGDGGGVGGRRTVAISVGDVAQELDLMHTNVALLGAQRETGTRKTIKHPSDMHQVLLPRVAEDGQVVDVRGGERLETTKHPVHDGLKGGRRSLHPHPHDEHAEAPVTREIDGHELGGGLRGAYLPEG